MHGEEHDDEGEDHDHGSAQDHEDGEDGDDHAHDEDHDHSGGDHSGESAEDHAQHAHAYDPHLWLDPVNAQAIVRALADALGALDPAGAATYQANALAANARLDALMASLRTQLAPVQHVPYVVFHDAYQYFEQRFDLHPVGSITVSPEQETGARRLAELRAAIRARDARCVFSEPQFEPRLVRVVVEGSGARAGTLDPLGSALPQGAEQYEALLRAMADDLIACLSH